MLEQSLILLAFVGMFTSAKARWSPGGQLGSASGISFKKYKSSNCPTFGIITALHFDDNIDEFAVSPVWKKFGTLTHKRNLAAYSGRSINLIWAMCCVSAFPAFWESIGDQAELDSRWSGYINLHFCRQKVNAAFTARYSGGIDENNTYIHLN